MAVAAGFRKEKPPVIEARGVLKKHIHAKGKFDKVLSRPRKRTANHVKT
jgi:hypothetical protein